MKRTALLLAASVAITLSIVYFELQMPSGGAVKHADTPVTAVAPPSNNSVEAPSVDAISQKEKQYDRAIELIAPAGFINKDAVTVGEFISKKVIMVDFWTYSCINCIRTLPYLNAWYEKYQDKGLEIIGVHTPEFEFEKDYDNVKRAVEKYGIRYPVALDNEYATWRAYKNRYWPRKYLIDIDGFIVYDHIGEGGYEETEMKIQELLEERMERLGEEEKVDGITVSPEGVEYVESGESISPEIYFGALRNERLGNGSPYRVGAQNLREPKNVEINTLYLVGEWEFTDEYAENKNKKAKIIFRYMGKKVFMVGSAEQGVRVELFRDGAPLVHGIGSDAVEGGVIIIQEEQLYRLVEDDSYGEHTLEIIIEEPGLRAFTFTFG